MRRRTIIVAMLGRPGRCRSGGLLAVLRPTVRRRSRSRVTPSGLPVPRYVSLKFDSVNARAGPSDDHRLLWVFHTRGLPVQVVAETAEWRRICDPDGGLSWVHRRTTDGRRPVMRTKAGADADPPGGPRPSAPVAAYLAPRAMAALDYCKKDWCKMRVDHASGWAGRQRVLGRGRRRSAAMPLRRRWARHVNPRFSSAATRGDPDQEFGMTAGASHPSTRRTCWPARAARCLARAMPSCRCRPC